MADQASRDVVDEIAKVRTGRGDRPVEPVVIESVSVDSGLGVTQPPAAGPDFSSPGFVGCYRHPERMTGISCQRCHRPICGECMNPASVGFQCPQLRLERAVRATGPGRPGRRSDRCFGRAAAMPPR